ncbi:MAG: glycoside hydrolase family 92 protein [Bacteroidales bacterium]|nr:glycoside hydrolase family 92 protein [Bacteroidales bacterium]
MRRVVFILAVLVFASCSKYDKAKDFAQFVNPFVGTDYTGNTYPGATIPFGMVQLSPDNGLPGWDRIAGYFYPDSTIAGFSHTHLTGTGAGDLYDISFMPVTNPYNEAEAPLGIHSKFSHESEVAEAGYYKVLLKDYNIKVELAATERCGVQRYTFPKAEASVFLNLAKAMNWDATIDSHIEFADSVTIKGYRYSTGWAQDQKIFFVSKLSRPFKYAKIDSTALDKGGYGVIARMDFDTNEGDTLIIRTAISQTGIEGAELNLQAEHIEGGFDAYRKAAYDSWNRELSKIEIESPDSTILRTFYTALYHTMTAPTIASDVDGCYRGADKLNHRDSSMVTYGTFSLWDTYRAAHPLYTYICPNRVNDMVKSFLNHYKEFGRLPVWSFYGNETDMMIGYHSVPVIVDAYLKGIGDFDAEEALNACVATANVKGYRALDEYKEYGYVPYDIEKESVSKTIEYSFDDWCIARMAEKMGKKDIADEFAKRATFYRNLYNPETGFLQARDSKGSFIKNFKSGEYTEHITESNTWQYLFGAHHDIMWMQERMGEELFLDRMNDLFSLSVSDDLPIFSTGMIGEYAHGNEPCHHVTYVYNHIRKPWLTQKYVTKVMHELYNDTPSGLCGNEDCGQMSAWYVFSAMGFYPMNPASQIYEIGSPIVKSAKINLSNGKCFTIFAPEVSKENIYIQKILLNGKECDMKSISHSQIMDGATITFEMGSSPKTE